MSVKANITDKSSGVSAEVTPRGALVTSLSSDLALQKDILNIPTSVFMTVDAIPEEEGGVSELAGQNGSVSEVVAAAGSFQDGDLFLTTMNIVLADTAVGLNTFGGLPVLPNGVQIFYEITQGRSTVPIAFKTSFDFLRMSTLMAGTGSKVDAFEMQNVGVTSSDAYSFNIDLTRFSPLGLGIRIRKDSTDRFGITIRDNLTGLTSFTVILSGFIQLDKPFNSGL